MNSIRALCLFVIGMAMLCNSFSVIANNVNTSEQEITVIGMAVLKAKKNPSTIDMVLARRAAIDDAYTNLIAQVYGNNIVGEKEFMKQGINDNSDLYFVLEKIYGDLEESAYCYIDDVFAKKLVLSKATKIVDEVMDGDGFYFVKMVFYKDKFSPSVYVETKPLSSNVHGKCKEKDNEEKNWNTRYIPLFIKNKKN